MPSSPRPWTSTAAQSVSTTPAQTATHPTISTFEPATSRPATYDRVAATLHWLIGLALLGQVAFGFLLDDIAPRNTPARADVINLHKSIGVVLGLAIVLRVLWRLAHRPPDWGAALPAWQRRAARLGHFALYVCMVTMPLSGYVASNFNKYGLKLFGVALKPWGPNLPAVYSALNLVHVVTGWVFAALITGHVLMALKHAVVDHDGVFSRMWPWSRSTHPVPIPDPRSRFLQDSP